MWKPEQLAADRSGLRYPSDLSDAEAAIVEAMIHGYTNVAANIFFKYTSQYLGR